MTEKKSMQRRCVTKEREKKARNDFFLHTEKASPRVKAYTQPFEAHSKLEIRVVKITRIIYKLLTPSTLMRIQL